MAKPNIPQNPYRIAIIGGGASAVLLLGQLATKISPNPCQIDVYDRTGQFARGIAYSPLRNCHLLNVRTKAMSAYAHAPEHFAEWAMKYGYTANDFAPRKLYGDYLESVLTAARKVLTVTMIQADVTVCHFQAIGEKRSGFLLEYHGTKQAYDYVVLASGNVTPLAPKCAINGLSGYFPNPWNLDSETLKTARHVALIGSGLTAVDAMLSLQDIGFQGQLTIVSRHGLLPQVHTLGEPWTIAPETVIGKTPLQLLRLVREQVRQAGANNIPWQSVIDALRPVTNPIWQGFTEAQQKQFMRHLYTLWGVHRHRMAPSIASMAEGFKQQGRLKFTKIRAEEIGCSASGTGVLVTLQSGQILEVDAAINCMGYRYSEKGRTYDVSSRLGSARFGELFETTAIPEIQAQADEIAGEITASLKNIFSQ